MMADLQDLANHFARDGFVTLDQLWSPEETAEIERELDRFLVECVPRMDKVHRTFTDGWEGELKSLGALDRYDGFFRDLLDHAAMREIATTLLGGEVVCTAYEFFNRPAGSDAVGPWHQDNGYMCYDPAEALAFWIALDDVDEPNGGVVYARGSHEAGLLPHEASGIHGFSQRLADADRQLREYPEVVGVLPRGGCAIHHCLTAHRSGPNPTDRRRRALVADYKTAKAVESEPLREKLERERDELLKRVERGSS